MPMQETTDLVRRAACLASRSAVRPQKRMQPVAEWESSAIHRRQPDQKFKSAEEPGCSGQDLGTGLTEVSTRSQVTGLDAKRRIISLAVAFIMVSMLVAFPVGRAGSVAVAASMRRLSLDLRAGQSSFVVMTGSKRVVGSFPKGFLPVQLATGLAFPMRAVIEAAGGVVRFEPSQNTVYFALGPVAGAYELGTRTLVDGSYQTTVRRDLIRSSGRVGTLYLSGEILKGLVTAAGGTMTSSVKNGLTSIVLQVPSVVKDVLGYEHETFPAKAGKMRLVTLAPNLAENCFRHWSGRQHHRLVRVHGLPRGRRRRSRPSAHSATPHWRSCWSCLPTSSW